MKRARERTLLGAKGIATRSDRTLLGALLALLLVTINLLEAFSFRFPKKGGFQFALPSHPCGEVRASEGEIRHPSDRFEPILGCQASLWMCTVKERDKTGEVLGVACFGGTLKIFNLLEDCRFYKDF